MMPSLSLIDLAHQYGGVLWQLDGQPELGSVSIDSRKMTAGDCFVAIRGEQFDAHDFLEDVVERGAASLVVEAPLQRKIPQWVVKDSVQALGQIARENRRMFDRPLVAITGSNGKTSVKEMLASILSLSGEVLATKGNLNNHIGVPLTLFELSPQHQFAVIEMGASALGEIEYLCSVAEPDIALVNNVGEAHLEKFGSSENIFRAKGEIYAGLKKGGTAVVNLDSRGARTYIENLEDCEYIGFSAESVEADVYATNIVLNQSGSVFDIWLNGEQLSVSLNVPARHNVANALAAAACAYALGVKCETIIDGLESFGGVEGRLQMKDGLNGSRLIDDSYNASPVSAHAAVDLLASLDGKRIFVLGDMAELGPDAERLHAKLGEYARIRGVDALFATGSLSRAAADAFGVDGYWFESKSALIEGLSENLTVGVTALVKGSRSAAMNKVIEKLNTEEGR